MTPTLPAWAQALPSPRYAPHVETVDALLGPLSVLFPLAVEAYGQGTLAITLQPRSHPHSDSEEHISFVHNAGKPTSQHAVLADPWWRPGPTGRTHALFAAGMDVVDAVTPLFGHAFNFRTELAMAPAGAQVLMALHLSRMSFYVPTGDAGPLHMATLLATLHQILLHGRPADSVAGWDTPYGLVSCRHPVHPMDTSFHGPGTDQGDRLRFYHEACALGHHISAALKVPFTR